MPKDEALSAGKRSAKTKGPEELAKAGHEAASTKTIRKAMKRLDAVKSELAAILELLGKVASKERRAKGPARRR